MSADTSVPALAYPHAPGHLSAMNTFLASYALFAFVLRKVVFAAAVIVAIVALVDWLVRTRRITPFNPVARFFRKSVDPLMVPMERRILRAGGNPASAPWWTLIGVVVGGLLLIWIVDFVGGILAQLAMGASNPALLPRILLSWVFSLLILALIVRVFSSWFSISPYSRWIRWSFTLTEWMLAPLRGVIPTFGMIDITPIVAYFALTLLRALVFRVV